MNSFHLLSDCAKNTKVLLLINKPPYKNES